MEKSAKMHTITSNAFDELKALVKLQPDRLKILAKGIAAIASSLLSSFHQRPSQTPHYHRQAMVSPRNEWKRQHTATITAGKCPSTLATKSYLSCGPCRVSTGESYRWQGSKSH